MTTLTITRGLPGSGKTTWAKAWLTQREGRVRVNRDDLRDMLHGTRTGLTFDQEADVTRASQEAVRLSLRAGRDVVVDDTNLRPRYVRQWRTIATECGAAFEVHEMPVDGDLAVAQDAGRDHPVGADVIRQLAQKFVPKGRYLPIPDEPVRVATRWETYTPDDDLPPAIIVDVDGTVALMGDRSPYDWGRVSEDTPNLPVIHALGGLRGSTTKVVFLSGRDESCRTDTWRWLTDHDIALPGTDELLMRPAGDQRRDDIVKHELFNTHVRDHHHVRLVLDDRDSVVAMWRAMGLTCLQVAPGAF